MNARVGRIVVEYMVKIIDVYIHKWYHVIALASWFQHSHSSTLVPALPLVEHIVEQCITSKHTSLVKTSLY